MALLTREQVGKLWQRVAGYGEFVRQHVMTEVPIRRWRSQGRRSSALLDEEFLRRLERLSIAARRTVKSGLIGEHTSRRKATSVEFADYRVYVPGDDFRRIDWNAYGRLDALFVKLTEAREDVAVHLLIDASKSMDCGEPRKLQFARQVAAALGYIALTRFDAVVAASFGRTLVDYLPVIRAKNQALTLFEFLNSIQGSGETDLHASAVAYCARTPRRGVAIVITDLLETKGVREGLQRLVSHGLETAVVHLLDIEELEPSFRGDVELIDSETGELVELTIGPEAIRSYQQRVHHWLEGVEADCRKLGVRYVRIDTSMSFERMVMQYLRARRLVA